MSFPEGSASRCNGEGENDAVGKKGDYRVTGILWAPGCVCVCVGVSGGRWAVVGDPVDSFTGYCLG